MDNIDNIIDNIYNFIYILNVWILIDLPINYLSYNINKYTAIQHTAFYITF